MTLRQEKLNTLFKKLIALFLSARGIGALVTVTDCRVSHDIKNAKVFIAVYPEDKIKSVMSLMQKEQRELHEFLKDHTKMKSVPYLTFMADVSEQKRQKISDLLKKL